MLTDQQINDICILSKDSISKRNICEMIERAMKRIDCGCDETIELKIGSYTIALTKEQDPIVFILLQSIMATRVSQIEENKKKIRRKSLKSPKTTVLEPIAAKKTYKPSLEHSLAAPAPSN